MTRSAVNAKGLSQGRRRVKQLEPGVCRRIV